MLKAWLHLDDFVGLSHVSINGAVFIRRCRMSLVEADFRRTRLKTGNKSLSSLFTNLDFCRECHVMRKGRWNEDQKYRVSDEIHGAYSFDEVGLRKATFSGAQEA